MSISVCVCLYNGEKFIEQQLNSLLRQTLQPDEVLLSDDCSSDGTVAKVRDFIQKNHLENSWKLYCNSDNKGYPSNFYHCMEMCGGEIVFLCDQDDIWAETKLEKMMKAMENHSEANVMACRFGLIDGEGKNINTIMEPARRTKENSVHMISLHNIFYRYDWPGMVLAYRNRWYRNLDKSVSDIPHDIFICAKAAEEKSFFQLDEVLAYHRRHENNTAAEEHRVRKLLHKERKMWEIQKYMNMLEQFKQCQVLKTEQGKEILAAKQKAMEGRYQALCSGKIAMVLKKAFEDRKNVRLATAICDLLIVKQKI